MPHSNAHPDDRRRLGTTIRARIFDPGLLAVYLAMILGLALVWAQTSARAEPDGAPQAALADAHAQGLVRLNDVEAGALLLRTETPGLYLPAPAVATDFAVTISGPIARTRVTQRFENPADGWVEGLYLFPLPEGAAVDTLRLKIADRFIEGAIKERAEARRIYETAKAEGKKASLVEQLRPNVFTNAVANIGPGETVVVQIEYQESLPLDDGAFGLRLPLVVAPRFNPPPSVQLVRFDEDGLWGTIDDPVPDREVLDAPVKRPEDGSVNPVTLAITLDAGFPLGAIVSDNHKIRVARSGDARAAITIAAGETPADRDFVLRWRAKAGAEPTAALLKETVDGQDYLMVMITPPGRTSADVLPLAQAKPREVIFVLDNSGSMAGESIRQAKASLVLALDRLTPEDRFNVIRFDDTTEALFAQPVDAGAEAIARAKRFVGAIDAEGGTMMLPALKRALADPTPTDLSRLRQIVFLTDGAVGNEAELFAAIARGLGRSRLFTVGIGSAPNGHFMAGAARAGRGTYTYISATDAVAARMAALFRKLEEPVMTDLVAQWSAGAATEVWPNPLPDLYAGEPVVLTAMLAKASGSLALAGNLAGEPWVVRLNLSDAREAAGIAKLWARNKIETLEERRLLNEAPAVIDAAVLKVALDHHLTSRLTSLVAVDVTPSRPADAELSSRKVPLNLPAGWDFDKVFGEQRDTRRAAVSAKPLALAALQIEAEPTPLPASPPAAGLALPQGATDAWLFLVIAMVLLGLGAALLAATGSGPKRARPRV